MAAEDWTEERIKTLTKLWSEGRSASIIGAKIGMTRNAVIGKRIRLGLPDRGNRGGWRRPLSPREDQERHIRELRAFETKMKPAPKPQPMKADDALAPLMIPLLDLEPHMCRWPVNSPERGEEFLFCAHEKERGSPYCSFHESIAWAGRPSVSRGKMPMRRMAA